MCVGILGKACPSLLMRMELICDSQGQQETDMSRVRQYPHVTSSYLFMHFFDSLSVGGEEEQDSVTQEVGHSHGGEVWVHPFLSIIQLSWGMLGENIGIEAPREERRWQSAPFHSAFWDSGFAEAPLSPSSGLQCLSKRWNFIKKIKGRISQVCFGKGHQGK